MDIDEQNLIKLRQQAERWALHMDATTTREDAQDIAQEALLRMIKARNPIRHPRTYLYKIVAHSMWERSKKRKAFKKAALKIAPIKPDAPIIGKTTDLNKFLEVYWKVANRLPPKQRTVVEFSCLHGWTSHEIAKFTGWPLGTVDSYKKRGLERLRSMPELQEFRDMLLPHRRPVM